METPRYFSERGREGEPCLARSFLLSPVLTCPGAHLQAHLPFAVVGSTEEVKVGNKLVRARQYPWGVVQGECGGAQPQLGTQTPPPVPPCCLQPLSCGFPATLLPTLPLGSATVGAVPRLSTCLPDAMRALCLQWRTRTTATS